MQYKHMGVYTQRTFSLMLQVKHHEVWQWVLIIWYNFCKSMMREVPLNEFLEYPVTGSD